MSGAGIAVVPYGRDEDLLDAVKRDGRTRVRVARPESVCVVLGRGSDPRVELREGACLEDGVTVARRRGGGCAVVLDPGNVVVSVVRPVPGLGGIRTHFGWISAWIAAELARLGIDGVTQEGTSDLARRERKIGGSCIFRRKDLIYYSTTLLAEPVLRLSDRYLKHPPREPDYRRGRPHRAFMGRLADDPGGWTAASLLEALRLALTPGRLERFPRPAG